MNSSDPSITGNTSFESCKSSTEIFCHEISNETISNVTTNIFDQLHYCTWRDIEQIYGKTKNH